MVSVRVTRGGEVARVAIAKALGRPENGGPEAVARARFRDTPGVETYVKGAVGAGTAADAEAAVLPGIVEFMGIVRSREIIGRIPGLRRVSMVQGVGHAAGTLTFAWTTDGRPIPVSGLTLTPASLPPRTVGGLVVFTDDVLRDGSPEAEGVVRDELVGGITEFSDEQFVSANAEVPDVSPAGLLDGVTGTVSADPATDLRVLLAPYANLSGVAIILSEINLIGLGNALPGGAIAGGRLYGILPLIASSAVADNVIAVRAPDVMVAEGGLQLDSARHASLEMDDAPSVDSHTPTPAALTSLWQTNSAAIRVVREINWSARAGAVQLITAASY